MIWEVFFEKINNTYHEFIHLPDFQKLPCLCEAKSQCAVLAGEYVDCCQTVKSKLRVKFLWVIRACPHAPINMYFTVDTCPRSCTTQIDENLSTGWYMFVVFVVPPMSRAQNALVDLFPNNDWKYLSLTFYSDVLIDDGHVFGPNLPNYNTIEYLSPSVGGSR